jgi:hypothetical protein
MIFTNIFLIRIQRILTLVYDAQIYWGCELFHRLGLRNDNTTFRKLDMCPPSREGRKKPTPLGLLERDNLNQFPKCCVIVF